MTLLKWQSLTGIFNPFFLMLTFMVAGVESSYKSDAVGKVGELGYFQIKPKYYPILESDLSIETQLKVFSDFMSSNISEMNRKNINVNLENVLRVWNGGIGGMHKKSVNKYIAKYRKKYFWFN